MKYIRIYNSGNLDGNKEEGIYKVNQYLVMSNCYECYDSNNERHLFDYRAGEIADTIEELCDELVFEFGYSQFSNHLEVWHLYHEISLKEEIENALTDGYRANIEEVKNIYGAIWTDKGLIYVAKMNEKGEMELL